MGLLVPPLSAIPSPASPPSMFLNQWFIMMFVNSFVAFSNGLAVILQAQLFVLFSPSCTFWTMYLYKRVDSSSCNQILQIECLFVDTIVNCLIIWFDFIHIKTLRDTHLHTYILKPRGKMTFSLGLRWDCVHISIPQRKLLICSQPTACTHSQSVCTLT